MSSTARLRQLLAELSAVVDELEAGERTAPKVRRVRRCEAPATAPSKSATSKVRRALRRAGIQ